MNKFFYITALFFFIFGSLNGQTWITNNPAWIYKFENIENLSIAQNCVDGNLSTFTKSKTFQADETMNPISSIYFDLGYMRYVKDFRINCSHLFPFRTIDKLQLFYSNSQDGPWLPAVSVNMPESYSEDAAWYRYNFEVQKAQYWKLTLKTRYSGIAFYEVGFGSAGVPFVLSIPDTTIDVTMPMEMPILSSIIKKKDNVVSYQMRVNFDVSMLEYKDYNLKHTIATGGLVTINEMIPGSLIISYMRSTPIIGTGPILNLLFKPIQLGKSDIKIVDAIYDTDTIMKTESGGIIIKGMYGDIDQNGTVQAYDASLALQYSVGLSPLELDPLPWEPWRVAVSDLDGTRGITANDASLILQHSADMISTFPIEEMYQNDQSFAGVSVTQTNNELVFSSSGKLFGLNIKAVSLYGIKLSQPEFLYKNMLFVSNIVDEVYNIGLCSASPLPDTCTILKIPFTFSGTENASAEVEMTVNENSTTRILIFFVKN